MKSSSGEEKKFITASGHHLEARPWWHNSGDYHPRLEQSAE